MFLDFLKSIFNLFCGQPEDKPQQNHQQTQWQQPQQQQPQHKPPQQHSAISHRPQHQDLNQLNQSNEYYTSIRARANEEGDRMAECFEKSHQAYARKDGASAKELSNQGKAHQRKMEQLNQEASDWIFTENNKDSKPGEIDLHGLYVKEAIFRTDRAIQEAKARGDTQVNLIVGKGLHSRGAAKLKPAIEDLMRKHQLNAEIDPNNTGVLHVQINSGIGQGVGPEEISRRLERNDDSCIVM